MIEYKKIYIHGTFITFTKINILKFKDNYYINSYLIIQLRIIE